MPRQIPRVNIPRPVIDRIPRPVLDSTPPPVVQGLEVPVIDVPVPIIEYPTLDINTRQQFEGAVTPPQPTMNPGTTEKPRLLPETVPILGRDIPVPDAATLITTGSTAAIAVATTMASTLLLRGLFQRLDPLLKKLASKKKNKKKGKVVLHFMTGKDGVNIFEYSNAGTQLVDVVDNAEHYIRDRLDENSMYDIDNKIIIDDSLKKEMTKDGQKRFSKMFSPSKAIAKKLTSKFSI